MPLRLPFMSTGRLAWTDGIPAPASAQETWCGLCSHQVLRLMETIGSRLRCVPASGEFIGLV